MGVTPALIALYSFVKQVTKKLFDTVTSREQDSWLERRLRGRYARRILEIAFLLALVLFQTTSSIYLRHPSNNDPARIGVSIVNGSEKEVWKRKELVTNKSQNIFGGPVFQLPFLQLEPRRLEFELTIPGWAINEKESNVDVVTEKLSSARFGFWKSIHIELEETPLKRVRLAPEPSLLGVVPSNFQPDPYKIVDVTVKVGDQKPRVINDFRQGVIWLGAPLVRLERLVSNASQTDLSTSLEDCLDSRTDDVEKRGKMAEWNSGLYFLEIELNEGDTIKVEAHSRVRNPREGSRIRPPKRIASSSISPSEKLYGGPYPTYCIEEEL